MKKPSKALSKKGNPGSPAHVPTPASRQSVQMYTIVGARQDTICEVLGICIDTLTKHYRKEIDTAVDKANAAIGGALFRKAMEGDTTAMIFWMKTRARWRETVEVDGNVGVDVVVRVVKHDMKEING